MEEELPTIPKTTASTMKIIETISRKVDETAPGSGGFGSGMSSGCFMCSRCSSACTLSASSRHAAKASSQSVLPLRRAWITAAQEVQTAAVPVRMAAMVVPSATSLLAHQMFFS